MFFLLLWLGASWLAGWLLLPLSRRLLPSLPDGGLAAGRVAWLLTAGLLALWTAVYHVAPLGLAPLWVCGVPLLGLMMMRTPAQREEFGAWRRAHRSGLMWSDGVFVAGFLLFAWIRARHPELTETSSFEKPMDAALMSGAARSAYLPFTNPWFAGAAFTDYYYFFHLCGALLLRTFQTPVAVGYNLVQPLICAVFLSALWSLCAALSGTFWRGLAGMSIVALLGHFEPLRQWAELSASGRIGELGPAWWLTGLDWWRTSRVLIPQNTINEYPAFTLTLGDAHAHFFVLPFSVLLLCLCRELLSAPLAPRIEQFTRRRALLMGCGALLGAVWMGNTWDLPVDGLLVLLCAAWPLLRALMNRHAPEAAPQPAQPVEGETRRQRRLRENGGAAARVEAPIAPPEPRFSWQTLAASEGPWLLLPFVLARLLAHPYLKTFVPQTGGVGREAWLPPLSQLLMLWGGVALLLLWCALFTPRWKRLAGGASWGAFLLLLGGCGLLAWAVPFLIYVRGAWGVSDLRHQDTVFKFGLQAWLLLGTAAACGAARTFDAVSARVRPAIAALWTVAWVTPLLCSLSVVWTRTFRDAPRQPDGSIALSLNGARQLSPDEQAALEWLRVNAMPGSSIVEAVDPDPNHTGDFDGNFARVSALSGVPAAIGWGQHVWFWGGDYGVVQARLATVRRIYGWGSDAEELAALHDLKADYVFVGGAERAHYDPRALERLSRALPDKAFTQGQVFIARVPR